MGAIPFEWQLACSDQAEFKAGAAMFQNQSNYYTKAEVAALLDEYSKSQNFANVATSGSYNDLKDKPTIPAATTVTPTLTSGIEVGKVNGVTLYAPAREAIDLSAYLQKDQVSPNLSAGTLIATIGGKGIYAPVSTSGDIDLSGYATTEYVNSRTTVRQTITSGTEIGSVNGTKLYAPSAVCVFG